MIPNDFPRVYIDTCDENGQLLIAKIAALKLLHIDELVTWHMSVDDGIYDVELFRKEDNVPTPARIRCPCYYGSLD